MNIIISKVTSWNDVLNAARFTWRKPLLDKEPSVQFKKNMIKAEHSPLRCLMFNIDLYDISSYVSTHLVRHVHAQPFVSSARPDIDGNQKPRNEQLKSDLCNMRLFLNAQELINISKVRLCARAEFDTRNVWREVINELRKTEPELANACVPTCVYRGFCPEIKSCGAADSDLFPLKVTDYHNKLC